jgi:hypothetical protein
LVAKRRKPPLHHRLLKWSHRPPCRGVAAGVSRDNQLYWDGKPVEIRRRLKLSRLQIAGAFVVGLVAIIGGLGTGLNEGYDFGCKRVWWTQGCSK